MRAMKDSGIEWIGEIPQEWNTIRAKYVTTITNGSDPKTEGNTPVYGSGSGCFKTCGEYKEGPTVLLGRKGTVDIPQYITGNYWNVDTAFDVKTAEEQLDLEFYYFAATCFDYKYYTATTTLPSMTQTNYGNMYIPFPPVDVQRCVVAGIKEKLVGIDALIAAKEKTNALLKERRQSIIYEAVTKGLNPDAPMKDSGIEWIGEIPDNWGIAALKRVATPSTGMTPSKANSQYWEGDIPWFSSKDIKADYLFDSEDHISQQAVDECGLTVHDENSVVFCARSGILRHTFPVSVLKCKGTINQDLRVLTTSETIDPEFLMYYLRGMNNTIVTLYQKVGATVESIEMEWLLYLPVVLPPMEEQKEIVEYIVARCNEIDSQIAANEVSVQKLKEYRQSIIYEAVTGKIEIKKKNRKTSFSPVAQTVKSDIP